MFLRNRILLSLLILASTLALHAATPDPLTNVPVHPRLILLDSDIPAIKATIASDPFAAANFAELTAEANKMVTQKSYNYKIDGPEKTLLTTARNVEHMVITLSGMYRLTGQRKYADRATQEMLAAAAYPDWNPVHFLDTAELTAALGIGYDWLYTILTTEQRDTIHTAIVHLGINPWLEQISPTNPKAFNRTNNWVQVCVGGETIGALAVADLEPERANKVLIDSVPRMKKIMELFAPDGGFEEGPTYWSYATNYNVMYLAALETVVHSDYGLSKMPGFADTGAYRIQAQGPFFDGANFGDSHEGIFRAPQMFWMATKFNKPEYAVAERRLDEAYIAATPEHRMAGESQRFQFFALVYYKPAATTTELPTVQSFERTGQAFLRSSWSTAAGAVDPNAWYIALKGGSAKASHGHLDLGAFILDAMGERWAMDLGAENYGVPQYFGKLRWTYFRTSTMGHDTLNIDSSNEDTDAITAITSLGHNAANTSKYAVLNLDSAYKARLKTWHRGVNLIDNNRLVVQDELTSKSEADVNWNLFTKARFKPGATPQDGTLELNGKTMRLHILAPANASFEVRAMPALPEPQGSLTGITNVTVRVGKIAKPATISILFSAAPNAAGSVAPIAQWSAAK